MYSKSVKFHLGSYSIQWSNGRLSDCHKKLACASDDSARVCVASACQVKPHHRQKKEREIGQQSWIFGPDKRRLNSIIRSETLNK